MATSVAEAAYYTALKESTETLGFASLARDFGHEVKVILWSDLTAARGVGSQKRAEWPYSSHGGEVLVSAGRTGEKAAVSNPAAVLTQPTAREEMRR